MSNTDQLDGHWTVYASLSSLRKGKVCRPIYFIGQPVKTSKYWRPPPFPQYSSSSNLTKRTTAELVKGFIWRGGGFWFLLSSRSATRNSFQGPFLVGEPRSRNFFVDRSLWPKLWVFRRFKPCTAFKQPRSIVKPCSSPLFTFSDSQ